VHHMHATSVQLALEIAGEMLSLAERRRDTAAQAVAHRCLGAGLMFHGELAPALTHFDQSVRLYQVADRTSPVFLWGSNVRVGCLNFAPLVILWQGYPNQALTLSQEALAAARELRHAFTLSHVLHLNCWLYQIIGDSQIVLERAAQQIASAGEHGLPVWLASGYVFHGWAVAMGGDIEAGTAEMRQGLATIRGAGTHRLQVAHYLGLLGHVHAQAGNSAEAISLISEALTSAEEVDERWFEAELHRLKGEALLTLSAKHTADAEHCFRRSLGVAQEQKAKLWELRAAMSLARLWHDHGKSAEAHDLLAPVYGWFSEGFDTADLLHAKALLDEIA
jgi:predicted ATPase